MMPVGIVCIWKMFGSRDHTTGWDTGCGEAFWGDGGTLKEYGFKWCPFCRDAIREKKK